jgi:hypothetical protein
MKWCLCFILLFLILPLPAQEKERSDPDQLFLSDHWAFGLNHGFTRGVAEVESGLLSPDPRTGYVYEGILSYTVNLDKSLGWLFGTGMGLYPFIYHLHTLDAGRMPYFADVELMPYFLVTTAVQYRHSLSPDFLLRANAGISLTTFQDYGIYTGLSDELNGRLARVNIQAKRGWKPAARASIGVARILANQDLLSLDLGYRYGFQDIFTGNFTMLPGTEEHSSGRYLNRGRYPELSLNYTFTNTQKQQRILAIAVESKKASNRDARNEYRLEERRKNLERKSVIQPGIGVAFPINRAVDPHQVLLDASMGNLILSLAYEQKLNEYYYLEAGFARQEYFDALKVRDMPFYSGSNAFNAFQLSLGGGKSLIGKNLYNYLNIAAGLSLSWQDRPVGLDGWGGGSFFGYAGDTIFASTNDAWVLTRFFPMVYVGLSKDFRIYKNLHFGMMYRYYQGLTDVYEQRVTYQSKWTSGPTNARIAMNGSYHTVQFGFRYYFGDATGKE